MAGCRPTHPDGAAFGDESFSEKIETEAGRSSPGPDEEWTQRYPQEMQESSGEGRRAPQQLP